MPQAKSPSAGRPHLVAHFRVLLDREEIALQSISPLLGLVAGEADPDRRETVILRRAANQDQRLFDWYRAAASGKAAPREVTIVHLDGPCGDLIGVWQLRGARPVGWIGPGFDALSNEIAMEELEIRYESIEWKHDN